MAIALVVHNINTGVNNIGVSIGDSTGANFLLDVVGYYSGVTADYTFPQDSKTNVIDTAGTKYSTATPTSIRFVWLASLTPATGGSHVINATGTTQYGAMASSAWSGITSSTLDNESGGTASSTATITLPSRTPSEDNCLVVTAVMFEDNSAGAVSVTTGGWTMLDTAAYNGASNEGLAVAYQIQTTATACAPQWTVTNSTANLAAAMVIFKGAGGGGGGSSYVSSHHLPILGVG